MKWFIVLILIMGTVALFFAYKGITVEYPNINDYVKSTYVIGKKGMTMFEAYSYKENIVLGDTLYLIDIENNWHYFIYVSNNMGESK